HITVAAGTTVGTFKITATATVNGTLISEAFDNLVVTEHDPNNVLTVINGASRLVRVWWEAANPPNPTVPSRPDDTADAALEHGTGVAASLPIDTGDANTHLRLQAVSAGEWGNSI